MALLEDLLLPYFSQRQVVLSHAGVWSGFRAVQDERTIPGQMMCGSFEMDLWAGLLVYPLEENVNNSSLTIYKRNLTSSTSRCIVGTNFIAHFPQSHSPL
jgi:hypothetical protein